MSSFEVPILILIFNRKEKTRTLFEKMREIKPKQLFISADGPREEKQGEKEKCRATRAILEDIDWDCEVKKLYRDKNLGCKNAVYGGISWFFEHVEQGIILEDDCIPDNSFFLFCEILLEKYKDNPRIAHITAHNPIHRSNDTNSYFFSKQVLVWGWATWRDSWRQMDIEMENLEDFVMQGRLEEYSSYKPARKYILDKWQSVRNGTLNSWAYPWAFSCFLNDSLAIIPSHNLINNIGFDEEATNTIKPQELEVRKSMDFPLRHPETIEYSQEIDLEIFKKSQKSRLGLIFRSSIFFRIYKKFIS